MVKLILFSSILTTLCMAFEVNGIRMKIKSANPFTNKYNNYEHSFDSLSELNTEYAYASHIKNPNFNQSEIIMNISNPNWIPKLKRMISGNQYANDFTNLSQKNNTQSACETSSQKRNLSSDMGQTVIERTSNLTQPQGSDMSRSDIQENINIQQLVDISGEFTADQLEKLQYQVLVRSNYYRKRHGIQEFTLDTEINEVAQKYANILGISNAFQHSTYRGYGENLYKRKPYIENLGEQAVDSWYDEIKFVQEGVDYNDFAGNSDVGHLTQLLWKSSTQIGVGVSKYLDDDFYVVVVNYEPPGNVQGLFMENLPKMKDISSSGNILKHYTMGGLIIFLRFVI